MTLTFNLPEQMFQTALLLKDNMCAIILKSMHKCMLWLDKSGRIYIHQTKIVTAMSQFIASWLEKIGSRGSKCLSLYILKLAGKKVMAVFSDLTYLCDSTF